MVLLHEAVSQNQIQEVQRLINEGFDVNEESLSSAGTPLHIASYKGHETIAKLLISNDADIDAQNINGFTPLHLATQKNYLNIVKLLLTYKASINEAADKLETALHIASKEGHVDLAEFLIFNGAKLDIKDIDGQTPLHLAVENPKIVKLLLRHGANLSVRNGKGYTPLHTAVLTKKIDSVKILLKNGSNIDEFSIAPNFHDYQESSLHMAIRNGDSKMVQFLIDNKANINIRIGLGQTPLFTSVLLSRTKIAEILIQNGADLKYASQYGTTVIDYAIHEGNKQIVQILNANIDLVNKFRDSFGDTPLELCMMLKDIEFTKLIIYDS